MFAGISLNLGVALGSGLPEKSSSSSSSATKVLSLSLRLNRCIFLSNVFAGEVVKNAGMNGATSKGEHGLLGAVEFDAEFGFDAIDGHGSVVSVIGDS